MSQADVVIYLFDVNEISTEELLVVVHEMNEKVFTICLSVIK